MSFIRRYWIAGLVILLVVIHAVMIGYVRSEATRLKTIASSEIPVGLFYKQSHDREWVTQLRIHLLVPPAQRLAARATIEHNRWVVHEAIEETIRRLDDSLFTDPSLVALKEEIKKSLEEALREEIVEKIVINDRVDLSIREFRLRPIDDPTRPGEESAPASGKNLAHARPVRRTTTEQIADHLAGEEAHEGDGHGEGGHGDDGHGEGEHGDAGHGDDSHGGGHGDSGHGGAKASSSHGSSKSSSGSHGSPKSSGGHGSSKSGGHGKASKGH